VGDIIATINEGRSPIVLTERRDHVALLAERLARHTRNLFVLSGSMNERARREFKERLAALQSSQPRVVVATGGFIGEGFDDNCLDTLFLTLPISWKGLLMQCVGRLHRLHAGKREVRVFDYLDGRIPMLRRMFERRLRGYRSMGYDQAQLPLEFEIFGDPDYVPDDWAATVDDEDEGLYEWCSSSPGKSRD
jgi:superfamily II DNA or RNA helicase